MIANISPNHLSFEDTHNTLKYANRAKNIKTNATRNVQSVDYHVSKYTQVISRLKDEISDLKNQLTKSSSLPAINGAGEGDLGNIGEL